MSFISRSKLTGIAIANNIAIVILKTILKTHQGQNTVIGSAPFIYHYMYKNAKPDPKLTLSLSKTLSGVMTGAHWYAARAIKVSNHIRYHNTCQVS